MSDWVVISLTLSSVTLLNGRGNGEEGCVGSSDESGSTEETHCEWIFMRRIEVVRSINSQRVSKGRRRKSRGGEEIQQRIQEVFLYLHLVASDL